MSILSKQRIHIVSEYDQVLLHVGNVVVSMPYATAFSIAQGIRLASKDAMRYAKEDVNNWQKYANDEDLPKHTTPYHIPRTSRVDVSKGFEWAVGWNGENVKMKFGNNIIEVHFTTALQISAWLRSTGAESKAWAGETGRSMRASSILSNAEENYRRGI